MDPFSIIGAVVTGGKTLFAITENILGFVDEVRTANQSIQGIYDEVDSLRQTLDAINHSLASSLLSNAIAGSQVTSALWPPVLKSIQDCELTIHRLYDILKGMKRQNSGVAARTVTAIKFSRSDREVQVLKGRIQAHNSSLQLVLQTITVHLCTQSPGIVINDLSTKIELLVDTISQLGSFPDFAERMQSTLNIHQSPPSDSLLSIAQQVALEGNVVLTRSEGGSAINGSLSRNARTQIEIWLEGHISDDGLTEASSSSTTSQTLVTRSKTTEHESVTEVAPSLDSDTDDEFKVEEIQVCLRLAQVAVTGFEWNHLIAEKFLKRAYVLTRSL